MKLATTTSAPIMGGDFGQTSSFGIAYNAKAFRVLSDTLYQNKPGSIVREISCNAMDSHIMAGTPDKPFDIHLPDTTEPYFSVRDYGVGLSDDNVRTVFAVYFSSTKDQSNDVIGAFGLGAKTPFSYTDQFTVTSWFNGTKSLYNCYIGEDGMPNITIMDSSPSNEDTGVEVMLSIRKEDHAVFRKEVASQLRFFPVKPNVINAPGFTFDKIVESSAFLYSDENISISDIQPSYQQPDLWIIQGNVGYPLDFRQISDKVSEQNRGLIEMLRGRITYMHFSIGQIAVTASREALEYNKVTVASINNKLSTIRKSLGEYVKKNVIDSASTDWERIKIINSAPIWGRLVRASNLTFPKCASWTGANEMRIDLTHMCKVIRTNPSTGVQEKVQRVMIQQFTSNAARMDKTVYSSINPKEAPIFMVRDANRDPIRRLKAYMDDNKIFRVVMFVDPDGKYDQAFMDHITENLCGYTDILRLSDTTIPPRVRGSYTPGARVSYYAVEDVTKLNGGIGISTMSPYDDKVSDIFKDSDSDGGYYVPFGYGSLNLDYSSLAVFQIMMENGLIENRPLYAFRESDIAKMLDSKNASKWVSVEAALKEQYAVFAKSDSYIRYLAYTSARRMYTEASSDIRNMLDKLIKIDPAMEVMGQCFTARKRPLYSKLTEYHVFKSALETLNPDFVERVEKLANAFVNKYHTKRKEVFAKYPLLNSYNENAYLGHYISRDVLLESLAAIRYYKDGVKVSL